MPTRTARTGWTGTLEEGSGKVELTSSHLGTYEMSFPKRAAEDAGGATSPEELIAAAHSACYAMQLSALIAQAGGTPEALDVQADVSLGPDPAGGFRLTGIKLTVRHHRVDQAHREGFGCRVAPAHIPDLARLLLADDARQIGGAEAGIDRADLRPHLAQLRLVRRDAEVADRRQQRRH